MARTLTLHQGGAEILPTVEILASRIQLRMVELQGMVMRDA